MTYDSLDINQKLNLKAALREWATYAIQHFQTEIDKKVYGNLGQRTNKKGIQRTQLSASYRFGAGAKRTRALRRTWYQNVQEGSDVNRVMIQFLQYGRYLDMGVGRGVSHTDRVVARQLKLGSTGRTRKPWYSKRKAYETHRLREILAQKNLTIALDTIESAMNIAVTLNL